MCNETMDDKENSRDVRLRAGALMRPATSRPLSTASIMQLRRDQPTASSSANGLPLYRTYRYEQLLLTKQRLNKSLPLSAHSLSNDANIRTGLTRMSSFGAARGLPRGAGHVQHHHVKDLDDFRGTELSSVSYTPCEVRGNFLLPQTSHHHGSANLSVSGSSKSNLLMVPSPRAPAPESGRVSAASGDRSLSFFNLFFGTATCAGGLSPSASTNGLSAASMLQSSAVAPVAVRNPNKAILTIEKRTSEILTANDMACSLFSANQSSLVGQKLLNLIVRPPSSDGSGAGGKPVPAIIDRTEIDQTGALIPVHGKVIEVVDSSGVILPVAIWLEPLSRTDQAIPDTSPTVGGERRASIAVGSLWRAKRGGAALAVADDRLKHRRRSLNVQMLERCLAVLEPVERVSVQCTVDEQGIILSCDARMPVIFGYASDELCNLSIFDCIPAISFAENSREKRQNLTGKTAKNGAAFPLTVRVSRKVSNPKGSQFDVLIYVFNTISGIVTVLPSGVVHSCNEHFVNVLFGYRQQDLCGTSITKIIPHFYHEMDGGIERDVDDDTYLVDLRLPSALSDMRLTDTPPTDGGGVPPLTSTPLRGSRTPSPLAVSPQLDARRGDICEGNFWGSALHADGSTIAIGYQIREVPLKVGVLYCVWIVRDPEADSCDARYVYSVNSRSPSSLSQASTQDLHRAELTSPRVGQTADAAALDTSRLFGSADPANAVEVNHADYFKGVYAEKYETLQQIGKGAFGCVRMAARKDDGLLVITKFIVKSKVLAQSWVDDRRLGRIPIEISLLLKLKHPNIVHALEVCENDLCYQLVMEKHGSGMDVFEFIERQPKLDEPLASFIFRQVVAAASHLHSLGIVHRDIKDENVIIDQRFHCKLIDFGSAAFIEPGKLFSTFCGTVEYCSPEVLLGNRYFGPELEVWSLGVLLFTLVFGESPFISVQEAIDGIGELPGEVSDGLFHLLNWMLNPLPEDRATLAVVEKHCWTTQRCAIERYRFERVVPIYDDFELNPPKFLNELLTGAKSGALEGKQEASCSSSLIVPGQATSQAHSAAAQMSLPPMTTSSAMLLNAL